MDRIVFSIFIIWLALSPKGGQGQTNSVATNLVPEEVINISLSDDSFVTGSTLYYQIVSINSKDKNLSKISKNVEVGLFNTKGERVQIQKISLFDGVGNGKFFIKSSLPSGIYYLIAVSNWSINNIRHAKFDQKPFLILNPFTNNSTVFEKKKLIKIRKNSEEKFISDQKGKNSEKIVLKINKATYGTRDRVQISISNTSSFTTPFFLSVNKIKPIQFDISNFKLKIIKELNKFRIPEVRGSIVSGVISSDIDSMNIANKKIALSIPGKEYVFKLSRTDQKGRFVFILNKNEFKYKDIKIYLTDTSSEKFNISLDSYVLDNIQPKKNLIGLDIDRDLQDWLKFKSVANQIENAYFEVKLDSTIDYDSEKPFYYPLGIEYRLDDYTRFSSVSETFTEIITKAALRKEDGEYVFKTRNYKDREDIEGVNTLRPLVLIDGMRIRNHEVLVNFEPKQIEKIIVVSDNYRYGPEIFGGIIDVITKNGEFEGIKNYKNFKYLYPRLGFVNYQPQYNDENKLERIPDYRTQLFWDPNINLKHKSSDLERIFYTSDLKGTYEVKLKGYNNIGEEIYKVQYFEVK